MSFAHKAHAFRHPDRSLYIYISTWQPPWNDNDRYVAHYAELTTCMTQELVSDTASQIIDEIYLYPSKTRTSYKTGKILMTYPAVRSNTEFVLYHIVTEAVSRMRFRRKAACGGWTQATRSASFLNSVLRVQEINSNKQAKVSQQLNR